MTFDQTQSISVSYLLSTAFASTSDPSGKCMYYITSNLEPSTVTQIWKFWQICGANRHGTPNLIFSISAPKIDNVCGFHGSNKFLWIAASAFIFGDLQPAVTVFGNLNLKTREWTYVTGYELQQMQPFSLDFYCTPVSRPFTVDENGYMTLITKGGTNLVYAADGNLHPLITYPLITRPRMIHSFITHPLIYPLITRPLITHPLITHHLTYPLITYPLILCYIFLLTFLPIFPPFYPSTNRHIRLRGLPYYRAMVSRCII